MEFTLKIDNTEMGKLLLIFNKQKYIVRYHIVDSGELESEVAVSCVEDDEILEILMDQLDSVNIEMSISMNNNIKIKTVKINAEGECQAFDYNESILDEYSGDWKHLHKIIYSLSDEETIFERCV